MKISTLHTQIAKIVTGKLRRFIPFNIRKTATPIEKNKTGFMKNFFTSIVNKIAFTLSSGNRHNNLDVTLQPVLCCIPTGTNNSINHKYHKNDVANDAASFSFIPPAINHFEKKFFMKTGLRKSGVVVIALLIANLFFAGVAFGQNTDITISTGVTTSATSGGSFTGTAPNITFTPSGVNATANILNTDIQNRLTGTGFTAGSTH